MFNKSGGFRPQHHINLKIQDGEIFALVGRSGAGCYVIIILVQKLWNKNVHLVSLTSSERRHVNDHQLANCYKS